jgi:hypothetical protein
MAPKKSPKEEALDELDAEVSQEEKSEGEGGLVSLKRTKEEQKKQEEAMKSPAIAGGEDYPYGLCLTLDSDTLDKLGLENLPKLGGKVSLEAVAEVVGASMNAGKDYNNREVRLQLTALKLEQPGK